MRADKVTLKEKTVLYIIMTGFGLLLFAPFVYMISISLATPATNAKMAFSLIPRDFHWHNYVKVFTDSDINLGRFLLNSVIISTFAILGQVFSSSLIAYGFARLRARGKKVLFMVVLSTMMIPAQVTMIPQFIIFRYLGWINTMLPLIVPNFFGGAFNIFLIRQFISRIPHTLDEAAKIDGLGYFGIYSRIILPLIKPIIATVAIFTFTWNWGWFMGPLIYLNDIEKMPLALGIEILNSTSNVGATPDWNLVMVASMLLTIPMILLFFFGQKYMFEANITGANSSAK